MSHLLSAWNQNEQRIGAWASIIGLLVVVVGLLTQLPLAETTKEKIYASGLVLMTMGGATTFFVGMWLTAKQMLG